MMTIAQKRVVTRRRGQAMPTYLVRETYTHEAWKFLVEHPDQEAGAMQPTEEFERMVAANGWTLLGRWWSFDDHQAGAVFLIDLPDRLDVASFAILAHARGHVTGFEATPLLSYEEARQALHAAAGTPVDHRGDGAGPRPSHAGGTAG
jgi:hypothetical protein